MICTTTLLYLRGADDRVRVCGDKSKKIAPDPEHTLMGRER